MTSNGAKSWLIQHMTWGDMEGAIRLFEEAMLLALQATSRDFELWEREADDHGYVDEYSLSEEQIANMSDEWRRAHVAALIRSIVLMYGASTELGPAPLVIGTAHRSPAHLLRGLNDIVMGIYAPGGPLFP